MKTGKETLELADQVNHTEVHLVGLIRSHPSTSPSNYLNLTRAFTTMPFVDSTCWR
jgi:hypothetical protein